MYNRKGINYCALGLAILLGLFYLRKIDYNPADRIFVTGSDAGIYLQKSNTSDMDQINTTQQTSKPDSPCIYKVFPDTFTLSEVEVKSLFNQMELEREIFNANVPPGSRQPALPLTEYIYGITTRNSNGTDKILVNGLPPASIVNPTWHTTEVDDGGQVYLDAEFDLETRKILYFSTHGEG